MDKKNKGMNFKELYIGFKWMAFTTALIYHTKFKMDPNPWFWGFEILYFTYLFIEYTGILRSFLKFAPKKLGSFKMALDQSFIIGFAFVYIDIMPVVPMLMVLLMTIQAFHEPQKSIYIQGLIGILFLFPVQYYRYWVMGVAMSEYVTQGALIFAYAHVLHEIRDALYIEEVRFKRLMETVQSRNELLEESVRTDFLTRMYNHQAFYVTLEEISDDESPVALILLDIDNFKMINDTYGHVAGDYVIAEIARVIRVQIRRSDIAARYGGEEFAVLLPGTELRTAWHIAERIRDAIESHTFKLDHQELVVTVSGGVGVTRKCLKGEKQSEFVKSVDRLLYHAKRTGKNRIIKMQSA